MPNRLHRLALVGTTEGAAGRNCAGRPAGPTPLGARVAGQGAELAPLAFGELCSNMLRQVRPRSALRAPDLQRCALGRAHAPSGALGRTHTITAARQEFGAWHGGAAGLGQAAPKAFCAAEHRSVVGLLIALRRWAERPLSEHRAEAGATGARRPSEASAARASWARSPATREAQGTRPVWAEQRGRPWAPPDPSLHRAELQASKNTTYAVEPQQ